MGRKPNRPPVFGVLDALRVVQLPEKHLIPAVASYLLAEGHGLIVALETARAAASLISTSEEQENLLAERIIKEIQRQLVIKFNRIRNQLWYLKASRMGSQLDRSSRINRLCQSVFGPPEVWKATRTVAPKVRDPFYTWFHRFGSVKVAGFDGYNGDGCLTGFVYGERGAPRYALLPAKAHSARELLAFLGLHPRLLDGDVDVDWDRQAFLINKTNRLPWVIS